MNSDTRRHAERLVWRDGDLQAAGTEVMRRDPGTALSSGISLYGVDPGSSAKGWAVAACMVSPRPQVRLRQVAIADLTTLIGELCALAERNHVLLSLDAPLRAFGGVQAPDSFAPTGAVPGARAWPFNVNAFSQRPCEKALSSKPPPAVLLPAAELRDALASLCGQEGGGPPFVTLHPGVSVLGYMGAPHAPVVRTFLDALASSASALGLRIGSDPVFRQQDAGTITVLESHPAVSLGFYASAGIAGFPRSIEKYKPLRQHEVVSEQLVEAVTRHIDSAHHADLEKPIRNDDELDAVVGLMNLLDLAGGTGDMFGTAEEGYFLVPRVARERSFLEIWETARAKVVVGESS